MSLDSIEWSSQPCSLQTIATQYSLPIAIRTATGYRGSMKPVILYSIARTAYAYGRALRPVQNTVSERLSYRPVDNEIVAIPLKYPGKMKYECKWYCVPLSRVTFNTAEMKS
ncbi:unnamed protein product [Didymodactylos carnosus]|uniref:Uncharacterized protein n=1 Tax=Didymodactylos carnosus TaxID=1234261 RepID=A0A8S2FL47_9BILA|nr:unnamed protein product [Didymodactylos carnosus]CAF4276981.1 unnamed protein product [Didymodactylos carnosus]